MTTRRSLAVPLVAGLLATIAFAGPVSAHGKHDHVTVVASGLDQPRGIDVGASGRLFVALVGTGGPADGYGTTGRIITISKGNVRTLVDGLPSAVSPEGEGTGPVNVGVRGDGAVFAVIGGGPQPVDPRFDTLMRVRPAKPRIVSDIQAFRNEHPDLTDLDQPPNPTDSNAYGLAVLSHGRTLVTDAAGNDLLLVGKHGKTVTVAKFPNQVISTSHLPPGMVPPGVTELPAEAVPTSVAVGPDGYWYVGELKGFPFTPGTSRIWRIAPDARNVTCDPAAKHGKCTLFADGFTSITGLDFGPDGSLYVVEIVKSSVVNLFLGGETGGALFRLKHGHRTELAAGKLDVPADVAVSRTGKVYVTNWSVVPGQGQVLRIGH